MKALTIWQPWAELIVRGTKDVENRPWGTQFRGWLLIHAGLRLDEQWEEKLPDELLERARAVLRAEGSRTWVSALGKGLIVGCALVENCTSVRTSPWHEWGAFGLYLSRPLKFTTPVAYRGARGLFDVADRLVPEAVEWTAAHAIA